MSIKEKVIWRAKIRVDRYTQDIDLYKIQYGVIEGERRFYEQCIPIDSTEVDGNLLMTAGANALWTALSGGAITAFSAANAAIGVGDCYGPGTISVSSGSPTVTGTGTSFTTDLCVGQQVVTTNEIIFTIASIQSATSLTATANLPTTASGLGYQSSSVASATNLFAAVNAAREGMTSGYPSVTNNQVQFQSTFGGSSANFAWNEWGVFNSIGTGTPPTGGIMLNRAVLTGGLGTKASGSTWTLTVTLSLS